MREFLWVLAALLVFFTIKSYFDDKKRLKALLAKYKNEYGRYEPNVMGDLERRAIRAFHESKESDGEIDDNTWRDLDMERLFERMNTCGSFYGEEVLYDMLRSPLYDEKELYVRGRLISNLDRNESYRNALKLCFEETGRGDMLSVTRCLEMIRELSKEHDMKKLAALDAFCLLLGLASCALIFASPMVGFFVFFAALFFNLCVYFWRKKQIRDHLGCFAVILRLINNVLRLSGTGEDPGDLKAYTNDLSERAKKLSKLTSFSFLLMSGRSVTGSLWDVVLDYFRMFLHLDLLRFYFLLQDVVKNSREILLLSYDAGMLDACIAVASYRAGLENWCEPHFSKEGFYASGLVHPLVEGCISNDIRAGRCVLLTGSNASGKSTFLRSVSLSAVMAQTVYTVCASEYEAPLMRCATSMAVSDDVLAGDSYYMAEIKSLKRLMGLSGKKPSLICAIDEVLRGTNTAERVAASAEILKSLAKDSLCFAATHDLELATILEDEYDNYHFTEDVDTEQQSISFSYKLMPGRAVSRNAIKLLSLMGYDEGVTQRAEKRCDRFLKDGIWEK